jgi:hypothetical protein
MQEIDTAELQDRFAQMANAKLEQMVYLVIGENEYGQSGPEEGSGAAGTERYLIGACLDSVSAEKLIVEDHFETLVEAGFAPITTPLQPTDFPGEYTVTIDGSREDVTFHNKLTWRIVQFSANSRITDFRL